MSTVVALLFGLYLSVICGRDEVSGKNTLWCFKGTKEGDAKIGVDAGGVSCRRHWVA